MSQGNLIIFFMRDDSNMGYYVIMMKNANWQYWISLQLIDTAVCLTEYIMVHYLLLISCHNLCQEGLIFVPGKQRKQVMNCQFCWSKISWCGIQYTNFLVKSTFSAIFWLLSDKWWIFQLILVCLDLDCF